MKNIFSLILRNTCYFLHSLHDGYWPQDYVFLKTNAGILKLAPLSPLSKIGENAFGAPFLQLYRKNDEGDPIFYSMILIRTVLPLNENKIGINLSSVFFEGQFY